MALVLYCELDTLAMVMIYQHWEKFKIEPQTIFKEDEI
jgi:hypothetical protein